MKLLADLLLIAAYSLAFYVAWTRWSLGVLVAKHNAQEAILGHADAQISKLPTAVSEFLGGHSRMQAVAIIVSYAAAVTSKFMEMYFNSNGLQ